jgi:hypothetical protein
MRKQHNNMGGEDMERTVLLRQKHQRCAPRISRAPLLPVPIPYHSKFIGMTSLHTLICETSDTDTSKTRYTLKARYNNQ